MNIYSERKTPVLNDLFQNKYRHYSQIKKLTINQTDNGKDNF